MTIRWGIIGTGDVTEQKSGPALYQADHSELVAITNRTLARAESWATRHGDPSVYPTVEALLSDSHVNAVYIATPPDSHAELTEQVANAGKHVFCEKPMAMSVTECEHMIEVCRRNSVSLTIAYYRRYFPVVQKMKALVEAGAIGELRRISATTYSEFGFDAATSWRLDKSVAGGGFLMDMGTHRFDLFGYFCGPARDVCGITATQSLDTDVEDVASVAIEFENGIQGSAAFHWNCPIVRDSLEIVGSEGILTTDSLSGAGRLTLETKSGREQWQLPSSPPVHLNLVQKLVDHLLNGTPNPCDGEDGMLATRIVTTIYGGFARFSAI